MLCHLSDQDVTRGLATRFGRRMKSYCMHEFNVEDHEASRLIYVARVARRFPAILPAIAEGRLHMTAVLLMGPKLTPENADELLAAGTHKTKKEIQQLIAVRFPRPDLPSRVEAIPPSLAGPDRNGKHALEHVSGPEHAPEHVEIRSQVEPLSEESFFLQATIRRTTHENMQYCEDQLGHRVARSDIPELLDRAFLALRRELDKARLGAGRPRRGRGSSDPRYIPLDVRWAVWKRDGRRCTFVGENGLRCPACTDLDFDHIIPVGRGGASTVDNVRLLCAAHNQYEAERIFGAGFMETKRETARAVAAERRAAADQKRARAEAERAAKQAQAEFEKDPDRSVVPWLRSLGVALDNARRADAYCQSLPNLAELTLEEKIKAALRFLGTLHARAA
jgi:5-methylcytosine-specific restriction endonuclease McrA